MEFLVQMSNKGMCDGMHGSVPFPTWWRRQLLVWFNMHNKVCLHNSSKLSYMLLHKSHLQRNLLIHNGTSVRHPIFKPFPISCINLKLKSLCMLRVLLLDSQQLYEAYVRFKKKILSMFLSQLSPWPWSQWEAVWSQ